MKATLQDGQVPALRVKRCLTGKTKSILNITLATITASACWWSTAGTARAVALTLTADGIVIDGGTDARYTLAYPLPVNAAKQTVKLQHAGIVDQKATLAYEGGGQAEVALGDGIITLAFSALSTDIKMIYTTLRLTTTAAMGAKWAIGDTEAREFPHDKPPKPFLYQGNANLLELTSPSGVKTALQLPDYTFHQLQDNREWGAHLFQWQGWSPYHADHPRHVIKIGDATLPTTAPAAAAPAKMPAQAPARVEPSPGPEIGATKILKWKDGKQAVFMLEFDDSCESHLKNAIPELKKRGLVGTFYINPGNGPFKNKQAAWEQEIPEAGMELANHTFTHNGALTSAIFERELALSNDEINKCFPGRKQPRLISYGPPGLPKEKWGIGSAEIKAALIKFNLIERPSFFGPPFQQKSKEAVLKVVDLALAQGDMGHLDFHGVGGDWHATPMEWFLALLDELAAHRDQLWITDPISWHKYLTERKAAVIKVLASDARQIRLQLSCTADPLLYDLPLNLATRVPAEWKDCQVSQGTAKASVAVVDGVARYAALPGTAEILLQSAAPAR